MSTQVNSGFPSATSLLGVALAAVVVVAVGCSPSAPPPTPSASPTTTQVAPTSAPVAVPTATLGDGTTITLELATTPEEISQGLMFRPSLAADHGMLFLFGHERLPSFWMKNTLIALDLVFFDRTGTVADVITDAQPCKVDPCPQYVPRVPAAAVLELTSGAVTRYGLAAGDRVRFANVPDYPLADGE